MSQLYDELEEPPEDIVDLVANLCSAVDPIGEDQKWIDSMPLRIRNMIEAIPREDVDDVIQLLVLSLVGHVSAVRMALNDD